MDPALDSLGRAYDAERLRSERREEAHWRPQLIALWERDNGICWLCGTYVSICSRDKYLRPTADHVLRKKDGGRADMANLRLAHQKCNSDRETREVTGPPSAHGSDEPEFQPPRSGRRKEWRVLIQSGDPIYYDRVGGTVVAVKRDFGGVRVIIPTSRRLRRIACGDCIRIGVPCSDHARDSVVGG